MLHKVKKHDELSEHEKTIDPTYGSREMDSPVPRYKMPLKEISPRQAYNIVHDEVMLDGNSRLNLATFVTTWMEPEARQLMTETFDKNMIDKDEYPQTAEIEMRCVNMLADLFHSPQTGEACGCSTTGSSEACMLGGMALKWKWRERMQAKGKSTARPNMVMGINVQVCWEKFCRYWDVEPRLVPMKPGKWFLEADEAIAQCDENTIGIVGIMGTTFTGQYEPIKEMNDALEAYNARTGHDVPLHVDAASGGFIAPFLQPELEWDFRLKWVKSINVSGHKYGPGLPRRGLDNLARLGRASRRPHLQGQLPGRGHAHLCHQLLPPRQTRFWPNTTTSCVWAAKVSTKSRKTARMSLCTCPPSSKPPENSNASPAARTSRFWPSASNPA